MSILSDRQLLTEIAHLYYEEGLNQEQISRRMNMSRSLISKMLTKARSVGIVEIIVHSEVNTPYKEDEDRLKHLLGLKHVKLTDAYNSENASAASIRKEIAHYLCGLFVDCKTVAVSASSNIHAVARDLSTHLTFPHVTFVPTVGGLAELNWESNANNICSMFAEKLGAKSQQLYAPLVVDNRRTKDILCSQPFIRNVLNNGKRADLALVGIGGSFQTFALDEEYCRELNIRYTVDSELIQGDVNFNYFDKQGNALQCEWNDLLIGLSLQDLRDIPEVMCIASEEAKAESIWIASRSGVITSLITTIAVARKIMRLH